MVPECSKTACMACVHHAYLDVHSANGFLLMQPAYKQFYQLVDFESSRGTESYQLLTSYVAKAGLRVLTSACV